MNSDKELARRRCDIILQACFGAEMGERWWDSKNKTFEGLTPNELWNTDDWYLVYKYLLGQLNGDYS